MTGDAALTEFVGAQRWFGSKSRSLAGGRVVDSGELAPGCALALFEAAFADGGDELYQLPMRLTESGAIELSAADPVLAHALLAALRRGQPLATPAGEVEFAVTGPLPDATALVAVRPVGGEQSNSSVVFGEQVILKLYRRLQDGESTELELLRFLDVHGFEHTPRLLGWYRYAGTPISATLGVLQAFVPGARDGWELALESFADPGPFLAHVRRLGEVTARMHTVLASDAGDPAFRPENPGTRRRRERGGRGTRRAGRPRARRRRRARPGAGGRRARAAARAVPRGYRRPGDPPARRLPPRAGAVGRRRLARARLRGRAGAPARRAPPQELAPARRRGRPPVVRLRGRDRARPGPVSGRLGARRPRGVPRRLRRGDRSVPPARARRRTRIPAGRLRAGEGALRAALRAEQPPRLGPRPGRGHPAPPGREP